MTTAATDNQATDLSKQYDTPLGLAHSTMQALKDRIKLHYDLASDYYLSLWFVFEVFSIKYIVILFTLTPCALILALLTPHATRGEHIHHGYWPTLESQETQTKEQAQINLIRLLLDTSKLSSNTAVLDVGCGIGGTSRYLASEHGCSVTGITISPKQVETANRLTQAANQGHEQTDSSESSDNGGFTQLGAGKVRFLELDAEKMGDFFNDQQGSFDAVWISEALSHFPNKALFFENAKRVLKPGGKLVLADWFKAEDLDEAAFVNDIKPIEGNM